MHDQATQQQPGSGTPASASPASSSSNVGNDVMKILADVEGQLTRLRSAQKQQDDAVSTLSARSKALRNAEDETDKQRVALKQQLQQVERDRQALQQERDQFAEQCKRIDEDLRRRAAETEQERQRLDRAKVENAAKLDDSTQGLVELEESKRIWQQTRERIEAQLQKSQAEINQGFADCAKARDEIAATHSQWEKVRQEAQAKLDARAAELDKRAADLAQREEALQAEHDRLATAELAGQRSQQDLQRRANELEQDRVELLRRVDQAERNVGELIQEVERTQHELVEQTRLAKSAMAGVAALQARERTLEQAVKAAQQQSQQAESESRDLVHLADSERAELQQQLESRLKEIVEARDGAMAELEGARKKFASMQRDLQLRDQEIAAKEQQAADLHHKLELAASKLSEFASVMGEHTPQLERGAAALTMVDEQAEQIDRLTKQLAELQLSSDPAEIQRRDQRIAELTDALRQARGQNADEAGVAVVEQRNANLDQEVQQLRLELQNAQIAAEQARTQLQGYVDAGAEQQVQGAAMAEHEAKVAALTTEIERLRGIAAQELQQQLTAQSKRHQSELAEARGAEAREAEQTARQLRQRIAEMEIELTRTRAAKPAAATQAAGVTEDQAEMVNRLRAKAEQITAAAEHMRRRRDRLEKMRRLIKQKHLVAAATEQPATSQMRLEQIGKVERERTHLLEVRKMLAASEYQMIRRWARQRAIYTMACIVLMMGSAAGAAWLIVNHFFPPLVSASVVMEARNRTGAGPLEPDQLQAWTDWHAAIAQDVGFQDVLTKRMTDRRIERWSQPNAVAARLSTEMAVDGARPGVVMYSLTGTSPTEMTSFLDVFANTLISESNRRATERTDSATTVATSERHEEGRVHYASVDPTPLRDERLTRGLPIFGIAFGALLLLALVTYFKLVRSKRIFDEENANLFTELRPEAA